MGRPGSSLPLGRGTLWGVLLAVWIASPVPAWTLTPLTALDHDQWGIDRGLPQSTVFSMVQDRQGYLWIGTQEGLARFDGLRFTVFDRNTSPELRHNSITALMEDPMDGLWMGSLEGLYRMRAGKISAVPDPPAMPLERIEEILLDPNGHTVWIASQVGVSRFSDGALHPLMVDGRPFTKETYALSFDLEGALWIGTEGGLYRWADGILFTPPEKRDFRGQLVSALRPHPAGGMWVGASAALYHLPPSGPARAIIPGAFTFEVLEDQTGALWAGSVTGLFRLTAGRVEQMTSQEGLLGETTYDLLEDRDGALWVGTYKGGLNRFRSPRKPGEASGRLTAKIESLTVNGQPLPPRPESPFPAGVKELQIGLAAIHFEYPERIRYRYRLVGQDEDWIDRADRTVARYTNLETGQYTFEFQAYDPEADGAGTDKVILPFFVPAKFHETLAFQLLVGLLVLLTGFSLNRLWANRLRYRNEELEAAVRNRTAELIQQKNRLGETHRLLERTFRRRKKANQELTALYREKSDFLAIAAHDLRAPLVNLKGFASELRSAMDLYHQSFRDCEGGLLAADRDHLARLLESDLPEALNFIDSSATQLEQLIGPILHLSRISRRTMHLQDVDAGAQVGEILESLSGVIADRGAEVALSPLPAVKADPEALADIMHELLNNALTFLSPGRPGRVEIFADEGDGEVTLHIRDNGRGIGDAEGGRVFRLFGHTGRSNAPGRGMGLVYVRTLVHRHGGRIWYRSRPGRGTTFSFTLPIENDSRQ